MRANEPPMSPEPDINEIEPPEDDRDGATVPPIRLISPDDPIEDFVASSLPVEIKMEPLFSSEEDDDDDEIETDPLGPDELDPLIKDSDPPGPEIDRPPSMTTDPPDDD